MTAERSRDVVLAVFGAVADEGDRRDRGATRSDADETDRRERDAAETGSRSGTLLPRVHRR